MNENALNTAPASQLLTSFSDIELIEELIRRGYEVYKWSNMSQWQANTTKKAKEEKDK